MMHWYDYLLVVGPTLIFAPIVLFVCSGDMHEHEDHPTEVLDDGLKEGRRSK